MSALFNFLRSQGLSIWFHGEDIKAKPRDKLTPDVLSAIKTAKPELLNYLRSEVAWRVEAMTEHARQVLPRGFWPYLVARKAPRGKGLCQTCSEPLVAIETSRCVLCIQAAHQVIASEAEILKQLTSLEKSTEIMPCEHGEPR